MAPDGADNGSVAASFPRCVQLVREKADGLIDVVNQQAFPDLDTDPTTVEEVRERIGMAAEWGVAVHRAYGFVGERFADEFGLCNLFGPDLSREQETGHIPTLSWPRDVLGALPDEFREPCTLPLIHARPDRNGRLRSIRSENLLPYDLEHWPEIRDTLEAARTVITAKALGLVMWANERITNLSGALVPTITYLEEASHNNSVWRIQRAGYSRTVSLTHRESTFLTRLATGRPAAVHRGGHASFLRKIPEMRPWISLVRSEAGSENESEYRVPVEIARRIQPRAPPG